MSVRELNPRALAWLRLALDTATDPDGMQPETRGGEDECQALCILGLLRIADGGYRLTVAGRRQLRRFA